MFYLLHQIFEVIHPYIAPICFVFAWIFLFLVAWSLLSAIRDVIARANQMHQIPCPKCSFFTDDHRLKCTVKPSVANTEEAIGCTDYCPKRSPFSI